MASPDPSPEDRRKALDAAFRTLVDSTPSLPPSATEEGDGSVKRVNAPKIQILSAASRMKALALSEHGLIGQFTSIWPSPKTMDSWVKRNRMTLISGVYSTASVVKDFSHFCLKIKKIGN